jgi:hypothetical protein
MLVSPSQTNLTILMVAGAAFAATGLWLLLRPSKAEGAAKIELFGLKFESSSAGILVFLIGAAFLALPLFVEPRPAALDLAPGVGVAAPSAPGVPLLLPARGAEEVEPNDTIHAAARLPLEATVKGVVNHDDSDWYVVALGDEPRPRSLALRHLSGSGYVTVTVFDEAERHLEDFGTKDGTVYADIAAEAGDTIYLRVARTNNGPEAGYELSAREGAAPN